MNWKYKLEQIGTDLILGNSVFVIQNEINFLFTE